MGLQILPTMGAVTAAVSTTQDFRIASMTETPKGAIFFWTKAASGDDHAPESSMSVGFFDGTRNRCIGIAIGDDEDPTNTDRFHSDVSCAIAYNATATWDGVLSGDSFLADVGAGAGVRITVDDAPSSQWLLHIVLLGGSDIDALYVDHEDDLGSAAVTTTIISPPFQADFVIGAHTGWSQALAGADAAATQSIMSLGVWSADAVAQMFAAISSQTAQGNATSSNYFDAAELTGQAFWAGVQWLGTAASHASGFDVTTNADAGEDILHYMAIKWAVTPDIEIVESTLPASAIDYTESGFTSKAGGWDYGLSVFTDNTSESVNKTTGDMSLTAISHIDGDVYSTGIADEGDAPVSVSSVWAKNTFFIGAPDGTAVASEGTQQSWEDDGFVYDFSGGSHDSVARKGFTVMFKSTGDDGGGDTTNLSMGGIIVNP